MGQKRTRTCSCEGKAPDGSLSGSLLSIFAVGRKPARSLQFGVEDLCRRALPENASATGPITAISVKENHTRMAYVALGRRHARKNKETLRMGARRQHDIPRDDVVDREVGMFDKFTA